jgi:hypothetical protein
MIDYDAWLREHEKQQQDLKNQYNTYDANWDKLRDERNLPPLPQKGKRKTPLLRRFDQGSYGFNYYEHVGYGWEMQTRSILFDGEVYMTETQNRFREEFALLLNYAHKHAKLEWATPYNGGKPESLYQVLRVNGDTYALLDSEGTLFWEGTRTRHKNREFQDVSFPTRGKNASIQTLEQIKQRVTEIIQ